MKAILCDVCGAQGLVPFDEDLRVSVRLADGRLAAFDLCLDCQNAVRDVIVKRQCDCGLEGLGDWHE